MKALPSHNFFVGQYRDFVNTHLLVHKHVKISVDEWILETTCPQKHVKFLEQYIPEIMNEKELQLERSTEQLTHAGNFKHYS